MTEEHLRHQLTIEKVRRVVRENEQNTTAEIQLNDWFFQRILKILQNDFGLIVYAHRAKYSLQDSSCVYGTSQPDLCFYLPTQNSTMLLGGAVLPTDVDTGLGDVVGGLTEFKPINIQGFSQAYAGMIRIASFLIEERLKVGMDISEVHIIGMLASHTKGLCVPLKMHTNFTSGHTQFTEGELIPLVCGFTSLIYNIVNF